MLDWVDTSICPVRFIICSWKLLTYEWDKSCPCSELSFSSHKFPFIPVPTPLNPQACCTWAWGFFKSLLVITEGECSSINCHGNWCCILLTIYSDWEVLPALKRNLKGNVMKWLLTVEFTKLLLFVTYCYFQSLCFKGLDCSLEFGIYLSRTLQCHKKGENIPKFKLLFSIIKV